MEKFPRHFLRRAIDNRAAQLAQFATHFGTHLVADHRAIAVRLQAHARPHFGVSGRPGTAFTHQRVALGRVEILHLHAAVKAGRQRADFGRDDGFEAAGRSFV